jgi:thioredoxin 1
MTSLEHSMIRRIVAMTFLLLTVITVISCSSRESAKPGNAGKVDGTSARITFLELGSTTCVPCKKMQPIMKSVETRYAGQVKVVFHDVMKDRAISQQYAIKLIPTQIFLDPDGKELLRHEGFLAEEEIDKFLKAQGVTPRS